MSEILFLGIAAAAAAFKALAIVGGLVWAYRNLLMRRSAPLAYRHTNAELPFRPWMARK